MIDNTNPSRAERERYISEARAARFEIVGYYFRSVLSEAAVRNANRTGKNLVPLEGLFGTLGRLERPSYKEGFDRLWYVCLNATGEFLVDEWRDDI